MKKSFIMAALIMGSVIVSCGASQQVTKSVSTSTTTTTVTTTTTTTTPATTPQGTAKAEPQNQIIGNTPDEIMAYAMSAPQGVLRAYGTYTVEDKADAFWAIKSAEAQAHSSLSNAIGSSVAASVNMHRGSLKSKTEHNVVSEEIKNKASRDELIIQQETGQVLTGAKTVKMCTQTSSDGCTAHVCVEIDTKTVADYLADSYAIQELLGSRDNYDRQYYYDLVYQSLEVKVTIE